MDRINEKVANFLSRIQGFLKSTHRVGIGFAFLSAIAYSVGDLTLFGASRTFHPAIVLVSNANISLMLFLIFALIQPPSIRFKTLFSPGIVLCGFLHTCGQIITLFANKLIGPGNAAALYYTMPVFAVIFSYFFLNHNIKKMQVISTTLSMLGVFLITRDSSVQLTSTTSDGHWIVFGICAGLTGAASHAASITIRGKLRDCDMESSLFVLSFLLQYSVTSIIYCTLSGTWTKPCINRIDLIMLVMCGVPCYFAPTCMYIAVSLESPPTVSIILTTSVFLVYTGQRILFPNIIFGWMSILGALLIFVSCVLVASVAHQESPHEENGNCENLSSSEDEERRLIKEQ